MSSGLLTIFKHCDEWLEVMLIFWYFIAKRLPNLAYVRNMIVLTENRPNRADMISHFGIFEFVALNVFEFQKLLRRVYRNAKP
ncbi:unnamed protein product [Brugia pahangi]|uniref:Uncharacterized protein n=1 Tax=Brugia pahangi TaxID=6280 RepID=A0A0N4TN23_BRUPA|nr:unnamed protein product [Brugia pahangi]